MREVVYAVILFLAVAAQVSVAPLFRFGGAELQPVLLFVLFVLLIEGPRPALVATPIAAIVLAFASGREPGLFVLGFVPLVLVAAWLDGMRLPVTRFSIIAATFIAAGAWFRLVLAIAAMVQGADPALWTLAWNVLLAGALLDLALLGIAYLPTTLVRLEHRALSLRSARY